MIAPYFLVLFLIGLANWGFEAGGLALLAAPLFAFGLVPAAELCLSPKHKNPSEEEAQDRLSQKRYPAVVSLVVTAYLVTWVGFLIQMESGGLQGASYWGAIGVMGLICGGVGINIAHELGHRRSRTAQTASKTLLATCLYMHFFIEHNRGHHRNVATDNDPASSVKGQWVYHFWFQSVFGSWKSAWELENTRIEKKNLAWWKNEMIHFTLIQIALVGSNYLAFGLVSMIGFCVAAMLGILLLETINYIEH